MKAVRDCTTCLLRLAGSCPGNGTGMCSRYEPAPTVARVLVVLLTVIGLIVCGLISASKGGL
jgi:phage shock protein PspC (stress-responsive transcriptional regulator)